MNPANGGELSFSACPDIREKLIRNLTKIPLSATTFRRSRCSSFIFLRVRFSSPYLFFVLLGEMENGARAEFIDTDVDRKLLGSGKTKRRQNCDEQTFRM